jgi:hypothetical protein
LLLRTGRPCACRQQRHPISSCAPEARSVCHVCCCSRGCAGGCASATHSAPASFKAPGECCARASCSTLCFLSKPSAAVLLRSAAACCKGWTLKPGWWSLRLCSC